MVFVGVDGGAQVGSSLVIAVLLVDLHQVQTGQVFVLVLRMPDIKLVANVDVLGLLLALSSEAGFSPGVWLLRRVELVVRGLHLLGCVDKGRVRWITYQLASGQRRV